MTMTKIVILALKVKFPMGAKLGLDTKWATNHAACVKRIEPGVLEVTTPVTFPKGAVLWVDGPEKLLSKYKNERGDDVSSFEVVDMPFAYQEENPADAKKRDAVLNPKMPVKDGKKAR